jgi:hypothetical protein
LICCRQLDVAGRGAPEVVDRRGPAQELLDAPGSVRAFLQELHLLGILDQRQHRLADRVPGGLVSGTTSSRK